MENVNQILYISPVVEIISIEVERGFATSKGITPDNWAPGQNNWFYK